MRKLVVLQVIAKLFLPLILLFALYIQFHGDFGPGGGFQAGVIFASGFILYAMAFDLEKARRIVPPALLKLLMSLGMLLYVGTGFESIVLGGNFLEYRVLADDPVSGQHLGIMLIELAVGVTVAAVIIAVYYSFVGRQQD